MEKESEKEKIYIYESVHLKLAQPCVSTTLQNIK